MLSMPQTALKENKGVYGITQSDILSLQYRLKSKKKCPPKLPSGLTLLVGGVPSSTAPSKSAMPSTTEKGNLFCGLLKNQFRSNGQR